MERNWILPPDVVEGILSRLPIRDLLQMRCVSKEWRALIDDSGFVKKHYQVRYSLCKADSNMPYIIKEYGLSREELYLLSIHQGDVITLNMTADVDRDCKAVLPYPYGADQFEIDCHGCVNGIVCLSFMPSSSPEIKKCFLALWNPATREFKTIAYPNVRGLRYGRHFGILGFGFDIRSNDFKILGTTDIHINPREDKSIIYCAIYSLKTNSWKEIRNPLANLPRVPDATTDGYLNGVYYWTTYIYSSFVPVSNFDIVSFNFTSEVFKVSDAPQEAVSLVSKGNSYQAMIALYEERLALVISHEVKEAALCNSDIWVVTQFDDCGMPLTWQHLFTIEGRPDQLDLLVDTILMNGDLLLNCVNREHQIDLCDGPPRHSYHYNHSRGEFKKFEIHSGREFKIFGTCISACFRYVESLFPISKRLV